MNAPDDPQNLEWYEAADLDPDDLRRLADACDGCPVYRPNGEVVLPTRVRRVGDDIKAVYRCGLCGHTWYTSWGAEFVGVTGIPQASKRLIDIFDRVVGWPREHGGGVA